MNRITTTVLVAALMGIPVLALPPPATAAVSIGISVGIAPPPLPVYAQPIAPGPGYIWTPGYWAWAPGGYYYWVPGTWVMPPAVGLLWTPGWWGWADNAYRWHAGYWAPQVGFYGGVDYGHGYYGNGYHGGYWRGNKFYYNRAVNNINITNIHNVYNDRSVVHNTNVKRVSYNGGRGGIAARPTASQLAFARRHHVTATPVQVRHRDDAMRSPAQRFTAGRTHPAVFATQRPGNSNGPHTVRAPAATRGNPRPVQHPAPARNQRMMRAPADHAPSAASPRAASPRGTRGQQPIRHTSPRKSMAAPARHAPPPQQRQVPRNAGSAGNAQHAAPNQQHRREKKHHPDKQH